MEPTLSRGSTLGLSRAENPGTLPYLPEVDGLRAFAILAVLVLHTVGRSLPLLFVTRAAWMGVDLFFVLSGFLITRILLAESQAPGVHEGSALFNFYGRRALRIWPLYYAVLLFSFLVMPKLGSAFEFPTTRNMVLSYIFYLQNLVYPHSFGPGPLAVTWSLAIEEQFYLVWPWLVRWLSRAQLAWLTVAVLALQPLARMGALWSGEAPLTIYIVTYFHLDGLAAGALVAILASKFATTIKQHSDRTQQATLSLGVLLIAIAVIADLAFLDGDDALVSNTPLVSTAQVPLMGFLFSILVIGFALVLWSIVAARSDTKSSVRATNRWWMRLLRTRVLMFVGRISYGLYLLHGIVIPIENQLIRPRLAIPGYAGTLVGVTIQWLATFGLATISWHFFESPLLRLKKHFTPSAVP